MSDCGGEREIVHTHTASKKHEGVLITGCYCLLLPSIPHPSCLTALFPFASRCAHEVVAPTQGGKKGSKKGEKKGKESKPDATQEDLDAEMDSYFNKGGDEEKEEKKETEASSEDKEAEAEA